jgi:hypothetical protein
LEPFISTEGSFLKHFVQCSRSIAFKYQRDIYFFPENQRFKNKMIDYAHHYGFTTYAIVKFFSRFFLSFLKFSALQSAIGDWLAEFSRPRAMWGPITKPQVGRGHHCEYGSGRIENFWVTNMIRA